MEPVNRRNFMKSMAAATALSATDIGSATAPEGGAVFLSTWVHGKPANERAAEVFSSGGSLLDAVERGINVPENDPKVTSVGYGGLPNEEGEVELDAAVMHGPTGRAGSVASVRRIKNVARLAKTVMERTNHVMIVGAGARRFGVAQGFEEMNLLTDQSRLAWLAWEGSSSLYWRA